MTTLQQEEDRQTLLLLQRIRDRLDSTGSLSRPQHLLDDERQLEDLISEYKYKVYGI